jgi:hypothetical protein
MRRINGQQTEPEAEGWGLIPPPKRAQTGFYTRYAPLVRELVEWGEARAKGQPSPRTTKRESRAMRENMQRLAESIQGDGILYLPAPPLPPPPTAISYLHSGPNAIISAPTHQLAPPCCLSKNCFSFARREAGDISGIQVRPSLLCSVCRTIFDNELNIANHVLLYHGRMPQLPVVLYFGEIGCLEHNRNYATPTSLWDHAWLQDGFARTISNSGPPSNQDRLRFGYGPKTLTMTQRGVAVAGLRMHGPSNTPGSQYRR